jgi:riboflavin synthase alpha subunit
MFTGLIEAIGRVEHVESGATGPGRSIRVATPVAAELRPGDSVAVNGVCLTVTAADAQGFGAEISPETLRVTTLADAMPGRFVNLERPLRADARLGGHFVLGHVDGVGQVIAFTPEGDCYSLEIESPAAVARYFIPKGSVAVDGISLTMAAIAGTSFRVQVVPFTASHTTLGGIRAGDRVNLEADVLGKYVAGLLQAPGSGLADPAGPTEKRR